jgi:hypothetical protein
MMSKNTYGQRFLAFKAAAETRIQSLRQRASIYYVNRAISWQIRATMLWSKVRAAFSALAITLFAAAMAVAVLLIPEVRKAADSFQPLEAILTQLGATFGTILALVLTLSIIPIQRAAEVWSPTMVRLYRHDRPTHLLFLVFGLLSTASFLLGVRNLFPVPASIVLAAVILGLAMSLDLLRWYHGHVCQLLDPRSAVAIAATHASRTIDRVQTLASKIATLQYRVLDRQQRTEVSADLLEALAYRHIKDHPVSITFWIGDLAEIATKAVTRGEKLLARVAIEAISSITKHYLSVRRRNLLLMPSADAFFLAPTSDVSEVTGPAYEALQDISRASVAQADHTTALRVSEAFQALAIHTVTLNSPSFPSDSAPLTYTPIAYLRNCVKHAQTKGLDEVSFQSAPILSAIAISSPRNISETDVHTPVVDGIFDIASHFYVNRNAALAEHTVGHMMPVLDHLLRANDFHFPDVLRSVLSKVELLAPYAIIVESLGGPLNLNHALNKVYNLTNPQSLGYLFANATTILVQVDEKHWVNPYNSLTEMLRLYSDHLRRLGEANDFGNSFLLWDITHLIKHIASTIAYLIIDKPVRPNHPDDVREVVERLQWLLAVCWVAFNQKKTISRDRADEVGEALAYIGLLFYARSHPEVVRLCVGHVKSIVNAYCETATPPDDYTIGDLMAHLWTIRLLTTTRGDVAMTALIDETLSKQPKALSDAQWQGAQEAIQLRREQLQERITEIDRLVDPESAEGLLRGLLSS